MVLLLPCALHHCARRQFNPSSISILYSDGSTATLCSESNLASPTACTVIADTGNSHFTIGNDAARAKMTAAVTPGTRPCAVALKVALARAHIHSHAAGTHVGARLGQQCSCLPCMTHVAGLQVRLPTNEAGTRFSTLRVPLLKPGARDCSGLVLNPSLVQAPKHGKDIIPANWCVRRWWLTSVPAAAPCDSASLTHAALPACLRMQVRVGPAHSAAAVLGL